LQFAILPDDAGEEISGTPEEEADGKRTDLPLKRTTGNVDRAFGCDERLSRLIEEKKPVRSEADSTLVTIEEGTPDLALQVGDLLADGGLGDVQLAAGLAEGAMIGYGTEVTEMPEFHGFLLLEG